MLRSPPSTRFAQAASYVLFASAGVAASVYPSPSVERTAGAGVMLVIWTAFLILGGLTSAAGRMLGRWPGEFLGLPLLIAAFAVYGVSAIYAVIADGKVTSLVVGVVLAAISCWAYARWAEVNAIRLEAVRAARMKRIARGEVPVGRHERGGGRL